MKSRLVQIALVVFLLAASGAGLAVYHVNRYVHAPLGLSAATTVRVGRGATLASVLRELSELGVVNNPRALYLYARFQKQTQVRAGEYLAAPEDTPASLLQKLNEGRVKTEHFAVIEGHNRWQVREALDAAHWMTAQEFDRLCDDKAFLARHGIPGPTCEGYLFPETYTFARGLAPEAVFAPMFALTRKVFAEATAKGKGPRNFDMRQFITLASIVEKETGQPAERPHIACVFYNRLAASPAWRLETDPTVIYAATLADPAFDGNLKQSHLRGLKHPYNTYQVFGLPPGPIANPGRAALEAVANPSTCSDFFFVSKNNGEHIFCPTLDCHNRAVSQWQIEYFRHKRHGG